VLRVCSSDTPPACLPVFLTLVCACLPIDMYMPITVPSNAVRDPERRLLLLRRVRATKGGRRSRSVTSLPTGGSLCPSQPDRDGRRVGHQCQPVTDCGARRRACRGVQEPRTVAVHVTGL